MVVQAATAATTTNIADSALSLSAQLNTSAAAASWLRQEGVFGVALPRSMCDEASFSLVL